ncbi:hypothetical protein, partial [Glaesserella parasuis]|uniref:hypothetical protein n=1 Tax=Glaesserella parasuis TaxID=738 RepID=UPI002436B637
YPNNFPFSTYFVRCRFASISTDNLPFYCLFQQDDKRTYSVLNQPIAIKSQTEIGGVVPSRGVIILINPIS